MKILFSQYRTVPNDDNFLVKGCVILKMIRWIVQDGTYTGWYLSPE